jgi:hypothetical protein
MGMTPRQLQAALQELESWQSSPEANQRRRFVRHPARGLVRLLPTTMTDQPFELVTAHVRDISRGGLGVLSTTEGQSGESWQMQLVHNQTILASLPGYCRHCRPITDGVWLQGLEFGIPASILLALGVDDKAIELEDQKIAQEDLEADEFVDPSAVIME